MINCEQIENKKIYLNIIISLEYIIPSTSCPELLTSFITRAYRCSVSSLYIMFKLISQRSNENT